MTTYTLPAHLTPTEAFALARLKRRHAAVRELFSDREMAHLAFLRWLWSEKREDER